MPGALQRTGRFRRVAIVHYWLVGMRGGERVLERLLTLFPQADIFTHVYVPGAVSDLINARPVHTTYINRLPGARRLYKKYLPLMPSALEHLDLNGYDLVISSESGPAKGVIAHPDALHLCYCHSPMRYLWDHFHQYHRNAGLVSRLVMPLIFRGLRDWDTASASRVDRVLANSHFIQRRIRRAWGRESTVVFPPVNVDMFRPRTAVTDRYLWVGQMTTYKRPDLAVDAFNRLRLPLLMVGDGEMAAEIRRRAGPTIEVKAKLNFDDLRAAYATSRALIFTAEEDFGIVPVEMMASGRPVLAYRRGGALDTVREGVSGLFFTEQSVESIIEGVAAIDAWIGDFDVDACLAHSRTFAPERFDLGILAALEE